MSLRSNGGSVNEEVRRQYRRFVVAKGGNMVEPTSEEGSLVRLIGRP